MGVDLSRPPGWRVVAASVPGLAHSAAGQPCADASAVLVLPTVDGGSLLVAVAADGAGSSLRGADGARLACEAILDRARRLAAGDGPPVSRHPATLTREDVVDWVESARRRVAAAAAADGRPGRDFSSTLLVALADDASASFFQIGDGVIVYRDARGAYVPALWPQRGEYANCTFFLTDADATDRVQAAAAENVDEVALLTDGLQSLALHFASREAHVPFFEPMFGRLRHEGATEPPGLQAELEAFLGSDAVNQRTDDDKTLVLATRLPPGPPTEA